MFNPLQTGRAAFRLVQLVVLLAGAGVDFAFRVRSTGIAAQAACTQRWCRRILRALGVVVEAHATTAPSGLIVSNHLGYLDILVLGAGQPLVFVAKNEVRSWPALGPLVHAAGTIFVRRDRRSDLVRVRYEIEQIVLAGVPVLLFPEGTSSDGSQVLPFHPGLFLSAVENAWPVTPTWIGYELSDGSVAEEICYWRDMTFLPHLLNLLTKRRIVARVRQGEILSPGTDRKLLAMAAHQKVCALAGRTSGALTTIQPLALATA